MYRYSQRFFLTASLAVAGALAQASNTSSAEPQTNAKPFAGAELAKKAKITIDDARAIALMARQGKITDVELEKEGGGSGLRYSFDIKDARGTYEIGVDAMTGKVLENKLEGPDPD